MTTAPDWESLRGQARDAMSRAYAHYSNYPVGAAALVDDGRIVTGCNVENASYGLSLCAECGLVSELFAGRADSEGPAPRLTAFTCVDGAGELLVPCGRCRQLLYEHGGPGLLVDTTAGIRPLSELLPDAFGEGHLKG
ncbi:cytidine deaminase [Streptomyces sioyaensis]|uniref:cytidine deaminase n=1 Tax=Streptomyces sioyaensis TaxID=67364 RepID=UPI0037A689A3